MTQEFRAKNTYYPFQVLSPHADAPKSPGDKDNTPPPVRSGELRYQSVSDETDRNVFSLWPVSASEREGVCVVAETLHGPPVSQPGQSGMRDFFMDGATGAKRREANPDGQGSNGQVGSVAPGANPGPSTSLRGDLQSCAAAGAPREQGQLTTQQRRSHSRRLALPRDGICTAATWRPFAQMGGAA